MLKIKFDDNNNYNETVKNSYSPIELQIRRRKFGLVTNPPEIIRSPSHVESQPGVTGLG